ncbi:MAG: extracellular solute-binding protein [Phycisphaerae bacterium]|nr:extracellular solute-binding protein [Phycisphaerae bacterium]MDW8262352.1 extracellular solute-binding protein [Phycisphaerales bacterium]
MAFPFGNSALALLLTAVLSLAAMITLDGGAGTSQRPDLIIATFTKEHAAAYAPAIRAFEQEHGVRISLQVVDQRALQNRLQAAMQVGAQVPDMVELLTGSMGIFTSGPLSNVGFHDLTDRIAAEGLDQILVRNRFGLWSSRGRIFALPHDVHPVMLAYRRDIVERLGINVEELKTWADFERVGREISKDRDGDGVVEHYMIDLPSDGGDALRLLLLQRGVSLFDSKGEVAFDDPRAAQVVIWYVRQTVGPHRIAFPAGWGQNLAKAMMDGTCLFYICPDWRTKQFVNDVPAVAGKMALLPLPAWEPGGIRTSTWGGTGLAFPRQSRNFELAWKLAMRLYFDPDELGQRFADTNILPPVRTAWSRPEFSRTDSFFSGQPLGRLYIELADSVPDEPSHTYMNTAVAKLSEAFQNISLHYRQHGEKGLESFAAKELRRCADRVRIQVNRNVFLRQDPRRQS